MPQPTKTAIIIICSIVFAACIAGCKDWEYDVEKNGIHFKKIHRSKGGTRVGYMTENYVIQGFPCAKGWIHFDENWNLRSFQLSEDFTFKNLQFPAHTWFHFPYHAHQTGFICSFPYDYRVQGHLCGGSGGFKGTQTGFYESGRLRSFFAPEDVIVDGVPCESSIFVNINLHENGRLKSCKLAEDYRMEDRILLKGSVIRLG